MGGVKITILGCGASGGVPAIGNNWGTCDPKNPKNERTRASIAVQSDKTTLIIDTGPDFRMQMNRENIQQLDAVIYTHAHADHVAGMDDLRSFQRRYKKSIPMYSNTATVNELKRRFEYMFIDKNEGLYPKVLDAKIYKDSDLGKEQIIGDISFIPFEQDHATCETLGFRFGNIGYSTDMVNLDDSAIQSLQGIDTWIVDGAGYYYDINVHANIERVIELNKKVKAKTLYLTHLSLMMDYEDMRQRLPENFHPCYDGLVFNTK